MPNQSKKSTWKSNKRYRQQVKLQEIDKANSMDQSNTIRLGEIGTTGLAAIKEYIELIMPFELADYERRMRTFDKMALNSAVATALDFNYILVEKAFSSPKILPADATDKESVEYAEFVDYCFKNMQSTLRQVARNAISFKKYGFSIAEKVYEPIKFGEYAGKYPYKIKKLSFRPQQSLDRSIPFIFSQDGRDILYARQNIQYFEDNYGFSKESYSNYYKEIPRKKFMLFGYNATDSNPYGESPLVGCFRDVKEMDIISEYEVVGVTRDLGGMLVFGIPSDILNKAAVNPTGPEAESIRRLEEQGALCHAGEQTSMIIPNELLDGSSSQPAYSVKLMGIDGGGKQYSTSEILKAKQKAIFDRFGAGHMILGDGGGSYALIEGKNNIHTHYIDRDISIIIEVLNNDLIPQLLALNGIYIPDSKMPKIVAGDIEPVSLDEMSKMLQRTAAVGLLPNSDPRFLNEIYEKLGLDYRFITGSKPEDITPLMGSVTSRSGDGMKQGLPSGTGNATGGGDTSISNTENV